MKGARNRNSKKQNLGQLQGLVIEIAKEPKQLGMIASLVDESGYLLV